MHVSVMSLLQYCFSPNYYYSSFEFSCCDWRWDRVTVPQCCAWVGFRGNGISCCICDHAMVCGVTGLRTDSACEMVGKLWDVLI